MPKSEIDAVLHGVAEAARLPDRVEALARAS
jgi:hypothetical protein